MTWKREQSDRYLGFNGASIRYKEWIDAHNRHAMCFENMCPCLYSAGVGRQQKQCHVPLVLLSALYGCAVLKIIYKMENFVWVRVCVQMCFFGLGIRACRDNVDDAWWSCLLLYFACSSRMRWIVRNFCLVQVNTFTLEASERASCTCRRMCI